LTSIAVAGTPTVSVYFDEAMTLQSVDRLSPGQHTLYVVAEDFDAYLTAIEYQIDFPAGMTWIEDVDMPEVKIGTTHEGITQAWGTPIDAFSPVVVAKVLVDWRPADASGGVLEVRPHPRTGFVRATAAPDHHVIKAKGGRAVDKTSPKLNQPALLGANPNPFNPSTQITYFLPQKAQVRMSVYDVGGRLVVELVDDVKGIGEHTVEWRADDVPSGVYFCQFEVGSVVENKKLILLK
jgi:hypothetical protein